MPAVSGNVSPVPRLSGSGVVVVKVCLRLRTAAVAAVGIEVDDTGAEAVLAVLAGAGDGKVVIGAGEDLVATTRMDKRP